MRLRSTGDDDDDDDEAKKKKKKKDNTTCTYESKKTNKQRCALITPRNEIPLLSIMTKTLN